MSKSDIEKDKAELVGEAGESATSEAEQAPSRAAATKDGAGTPQPGSPNPGTGGAEAQGTGSRPGAEEPDATDEDDRLRKEIEEERDKAIKQSKDVFGAAATFAAFLVFALSLLFKFLTALNSRGDIETELTNTITTSNNPLTAYPFISHFWTMGVNDHSISWLVFMYLVFHAFRLWLGIAFDVYDKSYKEALVRVDIQKSKNNQPRIAAKVIRRNATYRLWLLLCIGSLSFLLSYGGYVIVAVNLLVQAAALIAYTKNNWARYRADDDWTKNKLIIVNDAVFIALALYASSRLILGLERITDAGLVSSAITPHDTGLFLFLGICLFFFIGSLVEWIGYMKALWGGLKDFWTVFRSNRLATEGE